MKLWLTVLGICGTIAVAAIGGYFTYLVGKRKTSGVVKTTEAETLWAQSQEMREELKAEREELRGKVDACQDKLEEAIQHTHTLSEQLGETKLALAEAKVTIAHQKEQIDLLNSDLSQVREDLQVALREIARERESVHQDVSVLKHEMSLIQGGKA